MSSEYDGPDASDLVGPGCQAPAPDIDPGDIGAAVCECLQDICTCLTDALTGLEVTVGNWEDMPLGIEASLAPVGCITVDGTPDGDVTGRVFLCKVVDESTGVETFELKAVIYADGSTITPS